MSEYNYPEVASLRSKALICGLAGLAALGAGFAVVGEEQFFQSYLLGFLYVIPFALGCFAFLLIHQVAAGAWNMTVRRISEAGARTIVLFAILFLPILASLYMGTGDHLYLWGNAETVHGDHILEQKVPYLNATAFAARALFYFAFLAGLAFFLSGQSKLMDESLNASAVKRMRFVGAPALPLTALVLTFMGVDWIMSLDPHWFSSMWGFWFMASCLLSGMAFCILMTAMLREKEPLKNIISDTVFHDLGNLMMAFILLWAYISFSQFLIIWSGNLPEESPWYLHRLGHGWSAIALALVVFHWAIPFLILINRKTKRNVSTLVKIAVYMVVLRFVDMYWQVVPNFHNDGIPFASLWMDVAAAVGIGGVWLWFWGGQLQGHPLLPLADSRIEEYAAKAAGGHH